MITLVPREFHLFQAAGRDFLYLVPSAAVFALNEPTSAVLNVVTSGKTTTDRAVELLGVSTDGDIALRHRFAGSDAHKLGTVRDGIDRDAQTAFLQTHHIADKTDCRVCWARPLCSGGCYHEAHVRYGTTTRPNLHYCEWIRGWTDTCLKIYGELAERNPAFLERFDRDEAKAAAAI